MSASFPHLQPQLPGISSRSSNFSLHLASGPTPGKPKLRELIDFPHDIAGETEAQGEDDCAQSSPNSWLSLRRCQVTDPISESQTRHKVCQCRNDCCPCSCFEQKARGPSKGQSEAGAPAWFSLSCLHGNQGSAHLSDVSKTAVAFGSSCWG